MVKNPLWWLIGTGVVLLILLFLSFGSKSTTKQSEPSGSSFSDLSPAKQPPHPVRVGLGLTRTAISENLRLLNSFEKKKKSFTLIEKMKHNASLFTQGLVYKNGRIIESTGLYGESEVIEIDQRTGTRFIQSQILPKKYFGEGITLFGNDQLVQLTWQEETAFVYQLPHSSPSDSTVSFGGDNGDVGADYGDGGDNGATGEPVSMHPTHQFKIDPTYTGEGWGITYDKYKNELIVSDGSEYLYFWDPVTFKEIRYLRVKMPPCRQAKKNQNMKSEDGYDLDKFCMRIPGTKNNILNPGSSSSSSLPTADATASSSPRYLKFINELEYSAKQGFLLANVWYANDLILIDLETGEVTEIYDFNQLHVKRGRKEDCFNGIALDEQSGDVFVTGKLWPWMWRVSLES